MYQHFTFEKQDSIAIIGMKKGTIDLVFNSELDQILDKVNDDPEIRVAVLKSSGKYFCIGADLAIINEIKSTYDFRVAMKQLNSCVKKMSSMGKPIICVVDGPAVGGGANLALSGDFVFASEKASFGQVFVNINFIPDTGGLWNLIRLVGPMRAKELCMTGRIIDVNEAYRFGMITKVVDSEKLYDEGIAFARQLAEKAPISLGLIKQLCYRIPEMTHQVYCDFEETTMGLLWGTEDHKEGVKAFLEKRKPVFKGC